MISNLPAPYTKLEEVNVSSMLAQRASLALPNLQARAREFVRQNLLRPPFAELAAETYRRFLPLPLSEDDHAILEQLVALPAEQSTSQLRFCLLLALWRAIQLEGSDKTRLKAFLFRIDLQDNQQLTDELFMILTSEDVLPTLTKAEKNISLEKLKQLPKMDQAYYAEEFLAAVAKQDPRLVVELFSKRLTLAQTKSIERAFPYVGFERLYGVLREHADYEDILREVRDLALKFSEGLLWEIQHLFGQLAGAYDERVRVVLTDWIDSGDPKKVEIAISFLNEAPNSFALDQVNFVDDLFRRLIRMSGDQSQLRKHLRGSLFGSAFQGPSSRSPGKPSGKYSRLQATASEIANDPKRKYCQDTIDFYKAMAQDAASTLERERLRDEEAFEE